jgi:hypothetical protein
MNSALVSVSPSTAHPMAFQPCRLPSAVVRDVSATLSGVKNGVEAHEEKLAIDEVKTWSTVRPKITDDEINIGARSYRFKVVFDGSSLAQL